MTGKGKLALLIPAYNAAQFLPRLLNSAKHQSKPFDEIWVYDDCSTDDTAAVAQAHGAQVLRGDVNRGCSVGKNVLARRVDAEWIHFHDADDALLPNFVALARKWIDDGRFDVVLFDYEYRDGETGELLAVHHFDHVHLVGDPRSYTIREQVNPFCGLYRRSAYLAAGGYDEDPAVLYNEDVAFHIRMAFAGLSFAAENSVSIVNYRHSLSMSAANPLKCLRAHFEVMKRTMARPDSLRYHPAIAAKLWALAGTLGAHDDWRTADAAVRLASAVCAPPQAAGSAVFRTLALIHPGVALRVRECWVRATKPSLRVR